MDIWLLQTGELLPLDENIRLMRTGLLAHKLVDRGHRVTWWASTFDHMSKTMLFPEDTDVSLREGLTIKALKGTGYSRNISLGRYIDHKVIASRFRTMANTMPRPDVIVASTPDHLLAYESVMYAKSVDVPVLVDVRDEWPDIFLDFLPFDFLRPIAKTVLSRDLAKLRQMLQSADAIVSMMSELMDWSLEHAGRKATANDKVFFLGAKKACPGDETKLSPEFKQMLDELQGKFVVVFVGTFGRCYNPTAIVKAARLINQDSDAAGRIAFVIAGDGRCSSEVSRESRGLANVFLPGWLSQNEISVLLSKADIGIIPCTESINAFPNKAFTYLSIGLPVISSVGGDLRRMIEERKIGLYYEPNNYGQLAESITSLMNDAPLRNNMSQNASCLFDEQLDSDIIYNNYIDHIEKIAGYQKSAECAPATVEG